VAVLAIDAEDRVLLVRQYRVAVGELLLEIPAGTLDVGGDGSIEDPDLAARRELEEETGMRAGSWRKVARFYTAPGFTSELMHLYVATDLTPADGERLGPDEDEHLLLERMPVTDAVAAAQRGEFADAKSLVGLLWLGRERSGDASGMAAGPAAAGRAVAEPVAADPAVAERSAAPPPPGPEAITVTYRVSLATYVRAGVALARRSWGTRVTGIVVLAIGLLPVVSSGFSMGFVAASLPLVVLGLLFVSGWFNAPIMWWLGRKRPDLVQAEQTMTADDEGLRFSSAFSEGFVSWSTYRKASETDELFFLDTGTGSVYLIAKAAFTPSQLDAFYGLLERHGLRTRKRVG
jgi:ADP-ribose pyrophosphatase